MTLVEKKHSGGHPGGKNTKPNTPYTHKERLAIIKLNLGKPYSELMVLLKCSQATVTKDMAAWRASGGFEEFLQQEFFALHELVKKSNPEVPYKMVSTLLGRLLAKKVEANVTMDVGIKWSDLMNRAFGVKREDDEDETGEAPGGSV